MKRLKFLFPFLFFVFSAQGQIFDHDAMYLSYLNYKVNEWGTPLHKALNQKNLTLDQKLQTVHYLYGYIAYCVLQKDQKEAQDMMDHMETLLDDLQVHHYKLAHVYIYRSSLSIFRLSFNKLKAISYGKQSMDFLEKAVALAPNDPFVVSYQGNASFYMPSIAGGSKKEAISHYKRALSLYKGTVTDMYRWNVCETQLTLAQCYEKSNQLSLAVKQCEATLKVEPRFLYMRDIYLPQIKKELNKN